MTMLLTETHDDQMVVMMMMMIMMLMTILSRIRMMVLIFMMITILFSNVYLVCHLSADGNFKNILGILFITIIS